MTKKKIIMAKELTEGEEREQKYSKVIENLQLIPEPTYKFNLNDRVSIGNLKDVYISGIFENGKIYEIDYTSIDNNYGNPIRNEHCKMFVTWLRIRKYHEDNAITLIQNSDLKLDYSQRSIHDILGKAYTFGINFEPEYQRDYVWEIQDKINLVDSIFNNVDIGKLAFIRYNTEQWSKLGFGYEILDGKQRIKAILDFYEDRFKYQGKYFSDLSHRDQWHFENYPISLAEASNLTRKQILRYFIKLNTGGKIMSEEQINKVRQLLGEITE
jgi:hypothetical protein